VRYYELTREARSEFQQLVARSLLDSAQQATLTQHPLRRRKSEKRVRELRTALAALSEEKGAGERAPSAWLLKALTAVWLISAAATFTYVALFGIDNGTGVLDASLLVTTVVWLCVWIARETQ
jgi:predicted aminopeptidase